VADTAPRSKGGFRLTPFRVLVMVIAATLLAIVTASWAAPL
jgi:hypothetical protein